MNKLIIGFFVLICMVSINSSNAHAQNKKDDQSATHMWLRAGDNMMFVPANSALQCTTLARQAAMLNSVNGICFNREEKIKEIKCVKPIKDNATPNCS